MRPVYFLQLPRLQAAYRDYKGAGFEIIGVSLDENKAAVVDFTKARNIPWPQLHNASASADLVELFGVITIPAVYLVDPDGTIVRLDLRGKALEETLARLIKRSAQTARQATSPRNRPLDDTRCTPGTSDRIKDRRLRLDRRR